MSGHSIGSWLSELRVSYPDLELLPAASPSAIEAVEKAFGLLPVDLKAVLRTSNGLACRSFRLYSAYDPGNPNKTWESLQRANAGAAVRALGADPELLRRFLVFADIGNGFALIDRTDESIWFEETGDAEAQQTSLNFKDFITTMVKNAE